MICPRCLLETDTHIMSRFNEDILCLVCEEDERQAPNYPAARDREFAETQQGNYTFPGIGLSAEDRIFLAARLSARVTAVRCA